MANEIGTPVGVPQTTWGDCGNNRCRFYGEMQYGIEPGDTCEHDDYGCGEPLRWWDRWHNGEHRGERGIDLCLGWEGR